MFVCWAQLPIRVASPCVDALKYPASAVWAHRHTVPQGMAKIGKTMVHITLGIIIEGSRKYSSAEGLPYW